MSTRLGRLIRAMQGLPQYQVYDGIPDVEFTNIGIIPDANDRYEVGLLGKSMHSIPNPHEPRVNFIDPDNYDNEISITINNPKWVAGKGDLSQDELDKIYSWINDHRSMLLRYWEYADRLDILKVIKSLKK